MSNEIEKVKYPIEASMRGDNTFVHYCDVQEGFRHYCVCLKLIDKMESADGVVAEKDMGCQKALDKGVCPAWDKRTSELVKGEAIWYTPRTSLSPPTTAKDKDRTKDCSDKDYPESWRTSSQMFNGTRAYRRDEDQEKIKSMTPDRPYRGGRVNKTAPVVRGQRTKAKPQQVAAAPDFAAAVNKIIKDEAK